VYFSSVYFTAMLFQWLATDILCYTFHSSDAMTCWNKCSVQHTVHHLHHSRLRLEVWLQLPHIWGCMPPHWTTTNRELWLWYIPTFTNQYSIFNPSNTSLLSDKYQATCFGHSGPSSGLWPKHVAWYLSDNKDVLDRLNILYCYNTSGWITTNFTNHLIWLSVIVIQTVCNIKNWGTKTFSHLFKVWEGRRGIENLVREFRLWTKKKVQSNPLVEMLLDMVWY
jgi:hypothetical protein